MERQFDLGTTTNLKLRDLGRMRGDRFPEGANCPAAADRAAAAATATAAAEGPLLAPPSVSSVVAAPDWLSPDEKWRDNILISSAVGTVGRWFNRSWLEHCDWKHQFQVRNTPGNNKTKTNKKT